MVLGDSTAEQSPNNQSYPSAQRHSVTLLSSPIDSRFKMISAVLAFAVSALALPAEYLDSAREVPTLAFGMQWDYPLGLKMTADQANASVPFYSVDLWDTDASEIQTMQDAGHYVSCYFSAGTLEGWRGDADKVPPAAIGNTMADWSDERWVDVRNTDIRSIMVDRIAMAVEKNCNGVDPDNIDGYQPDHDPGFLLTEQDAKDYVVFLCEAAHSRGLGCGLKNGGGLAQDLVAVTDWDINESCVEFNECDALQPFIDAGKPVFHVEYVSMTEVSEDERERLCGPAQFSSIIKNQELNGAFTLYCN